MKITTDFDMKSVNKTNEKHEREERKINKNGGEKLNDRTNKRKRNIQ